MQCRTLAHAVVAASVAVAGACGGSRVDGDPSAESRREVVASSLHAWRVGPHPESVTIDGARVYVTHFGPALEPMTQDGDGYIGVYDANGQMIDTLVTRLDAPKGTEVVGDVLYVADVDTLFGFSIATGKPVFTRAMPGTSFLNGLAAGEAGVLYLSATDVGKVWRVSTADGSVEEVVTLPGVNGLAYDGTSGLLYAVLYPQGEQVERGVYVIDPRARTANRLGTYGGVLDGVAIAGGELYFTDWNPEGAGRMVAMDVASGVTRIVVEDALLKGPADFDLLGDGLALVPTLLTDRVVTIKVRP